MVGIGVAVLIVLVFVVRGLVSHKGKKGSDIDEAGTVAREEAESSTDS
jgi:hypothetical protein